MGKPLFVLEDAFIDAAAYGFSDDDTTGIFADALEQGRRIIDASVRSTAARTDDWREMAADISVRWDRDGIVVDYPEQYAEDIEAMEYGRPDVAMRPVIRPSIYQAARDAIKAIEMGVAS